MGDLHPHYFQWKDKTISLKPQKSRQHVTKLKSGFLLQKKKLNGGFV